MLSTYTVGHLVDSYLLADTPQAGLHLTGNRRRKKTRSAMTKRFVLLRN